MSSGHPTVATEFVEEAFETAVSEDKEDRLLELFDGIISDLRDQMVSDEKVEKLLRGGEGSYVLKSGMTQDGLQPESFTQDAVINPILDALGYEYMTEAGGLSGGRTKVADYTVSLRDHPGVDSTRLLIEAEPINKDLDSRKHGIGQVRDWLSQREFESDFGFATDGLRWVFIRYDPDSYTHNVIEEIDLQPVFLALFENQVGARDDPAEAVFDADRERVTRLIRTFEFENFTSIAGDARQVLKQKREEITDEFYDDYIRYVFGIVSDDEETARSLVGDGVVVPDGATEDQARLFAVELMNRLVFIKFLEDKSLVHSSLLQTLTETYDAGMYTGSFYEEFLQPLFYDVMNEQPSRRSENVQNIDLFQDIPYLNGGLFRPTINGDDFDEDEFDVRNSVLFSIIDLLERYSFSAGGAPTDLDPSVLGNVFEKTINYITSDNADNNKELGAYYTPSEITRFSAEETVRPALLDRFKRVLSEERDWPEPEVERYDSVYELIEDMPSSWNLISTFLAEVDEFRVVDPACGSGHFLTSVLEEIVNIRKALYVQYEDEDGDDEPYPDEYKLKKTTVLNNIYGVDLMGPAVEIAKLRCWLSVIAELETENVDELADDDALALPNVAFNLREGNSLIGYTGFPETTDDGEQYQIGSFSEDSVRDRYEDIITEIERHERALDSETAEKHRKRANEKLRMAREELIEDIHGDFVDAGVEDVTLEEVAKLQPFNWVLEFAEVYADGGFDIVVGNPPWDVLSASMEDFFSRYEPRFRTFSQDRKQRYKEELLEEDSVREKWKQYQRQSQLLSDYFKNSDEYELQTPTVAGKTATYKNDLSKLFFERVFRIADEGGYVSQVLPGTIFKDQSSKDLRLELLNQAKLDALVEFENNGIFQSIHRQYRFGIVVFENGGYTDELNGVFDQRDVDILENFKQKSIVIPRRVLEEYSPEARIFPTVTKQEEVDVLGQILTHPSLGEELTETWKVNTLSEELNKTRDSDRWVESQHDADYPVYAGKNIHQYQYDNEVSPDINEVSLWSVEEDITPKKSAKQRIRTKRYNKGEPKKALYEHFGGTESSKTQVQFVNDLLQEHRDEDLSKNDVLLDCTEYRIAYRAITNSTNERTFIATVLPEGVPCVHSLHTVRPYTIRPSESDLDSTPLHTVYKRLFTDKELFVTVVLFNSVPFDFLMRTKISENILKYKVEESQVPRLTDGDRWFDYISTRAARLNCYGDEFEEMRERLGGIEPATGMEERRELQAEIDAAAFHAYGLDHEQTAFVLDDFYRVQNPRLMDEDYFDMVLRKYEELSN